MGTNYYLASPIFDGVGNRHGLHVGKSAVGWVFHWRAHSNVPVGELSYDIKSRNDWECLAHEIGDCIVVDEYGDLHTWKEFSERAYIENRDPDRVLKVAPEDDPAHRCGSVCAFLKQLEWVDSNGEQFQHYEFS